MGDQGAIAVLLDVDGTLIDSNLLHVLAWSRAFRRIGREIEANVILHAIGMGGDRLVPAILGEIDEATAEEARDAHKEEYVGKRLIQHAEALPGAVDLLAALRARGARTALASSANADELEHYLGLLGGRDRFDAIVKRDDVPSTKPAPHIFSVALDRLGRPRRAIVLGDTVYDVQAARELALPCVCLLTGGLERRILTESGAAAIYEGPAAIAADLDRVLTLA